jgi:hypothetical protein
MKNGVFWDVTPCEEPHGVTSQKTPFFTLKIVYYSYFNSIINYGLPFWGNSPQ